MHHQYGNCFARNLPSSTIENTLDPSGVDLMTIPIPIEEEAIEELVPQSEGYQAVLQNKNFLALWIGQILSQLGDRVVFVVFIAIIARYFGSSDFYNSFLYIAFTIPAILLTAIAGVFVDRWPRRAVLVTTNVLRAAFVALMPFVDQTNAWLIFVLAFLLSAATQFFVPAEAATIPMIVRKTQLISANSLFTTTMMASVIFGFVLGDPLINIFTLEKVHWSIVGLFLLASIALMFVRPPAYCSLSASPEVVAAETTTRPKTVAEGFSKFMAEMKEGVDYIRENPVILKSMLKLALLFSSVVALCLLFISYAKEFLYDNPQVAATKFSYIITFSGVGMVLGAYLVGQFFRSARRGLMVYGGFSMLGLCLLLLCLVDWIPKPAIFFASERMKMSFLYLDPFTLTFRMLYTYVLVSLMGIGASFVAIPLQALLHELIPEDKRGKILGVQFTILSTCSTLPALIAGLGADFFGVIPMFLLIGLPVLFIGIRGLYNRTKQSHANIANW